MVLKKNNKKNNNSNDNNLILKEIPSSKQVHVMKKHVLIA